MAVLAALAAGLADAPAGAQQTPPDAREQAQADTPAPAQPARPADEQLEKAWKSLDALKLRLDQIEATLRRDGLSDRELAESRAKVDPIRQEALDVAAAVAPRVQAIDARLKQLGPAPEDGKATESDLIASERVAQTALRADYEGAVIQSRLLGVRAEELSSRIADRRRALFADRIFERQHSALSPTLWYEAFAAAPIVLTRLWLLLSEWTANLRAKADATMIVAMAGAVLIFALALLPGRRKLLKLSDRDPARTQPSDLQKATAAAWLTLVYVLVPFLALAIVYAGLQLFELMPARVERLANSAFAAILFYSLGQGLAWAFLAPTRPTWRLAALADAPARRILAFVLLAVAVFATSSFLDTANRVLFAPLSVSVGKDVATSLIIAVSVGCALGAAAHKQENQRGTGAGALWWPWLVRLAWLAVAIIPVAALFGYLSLASFIASQLIIGGIILVVLVLLLRLCDSFFSIGLRADGPLTAKLGDALGLRGDTLSQIATLLGALIRVTLVLVAASFLAVPWGIESKDVFSSLRTGFFGFTIGEFRISFSAILIALAVFLAGVLITRAAQRWLDQRFLPQTRLDTGVRNSLKTTFGYLGIILSAVIGFAYVGLDLSNLAIVAGALSVGIGFGLQSIVNNFVSGLILLAERPIKTGDWIVVGAEEGYVRKISVRATEIETFDKATVIVPNSDLISGVVKNWMHGSLMGRLRVPVGVAYDCDPEQVRDILLKCAEEHPTVLREPEPQVMFQEFGASSLDFELRVHIAHVDSGLSVRSDLRFAILKAFRDAGIEIPFPQQDLNLRNAEGLEAALQALAVDAKRGRSAGGSAPEPGGRASDKPA